MISCIVIDDQKEALVILEKHINATPELSLKLSTLDPIEGLNYLNKEKIDLVFIDVEMPDITGLDFIENIRDKQGSSSPKFILTTGYSQYALKGYEYGIIDYLLKPINYARFKKAVDRILIDAGNSNLTLPSKDFVFLEFDAKKIRVDFKDIAYIEAAGNYLYIVSPKGKKTVVYKSMNAMQELLPLEYFVRVHKSYIVPISKIKSLVGNEIEIEVNDENKTLPIGGTFKETVIKRLEIK